MRLIVKDETGQIIGNVMAIEVTLDQVKVHILDKNQENVAYFYYDCEGTIELKAKFLEEKY